MGSKERTEGMLVLKDSLCTRDEQRPGQGRQVVIQGRHEQRVGYWKFRSLFLLEWDLVFQITRNDEFFLLGVHNELCGRGCTVRLNDLSLSVSRDYHYSPSKIAVRSNNMGCFQPTSFRHQPTQGMILEDVHFLSHFCLLSVNARCMRDGSVMKPLWYVKYTLMQT